MAVSGGFLLWPELRKLAGGSNELNTLQTIQLMNQKNAVVLDVREKQDYAGGHIPNAKHIPLHELQTRLKELERFKARPIIVSCRTGTRAQTACRLLSKHAFQQVYQLKGGVAAWKQASLPLEK